MQGIQVDWRYERNSNELIWHVTMKLKLPKVTQKAEPGHILFIECMLIAGEYSIIIYIYVQPYSI